MPPCEDPPEEPHEGADADSSCRFEELSCGEIPAGEGIEHRREAQLPLGSKFLANLCVYWPTTYRTITSADTSQQPVNSSVSRSRL
jgi:hypothetical protein